MIKADTQRHYLFFFSKIANEKHEWIEYEKPKYELDERIYKWIDYLEKNQTKQKQKQFIIKNQCLILQFFLWFLRFIWSITNYWWKSVWNF